MRQDPRGRVEAAGPRKGKERKGRSIDPLSFAPQGNNSHSSKYRLRTGFPGKKVYAGGERCMKQPWDRLEGEAVPRHLHEAGGVCMEWVAPDW